MSSHESLTNDHPSSPASPPRPKLPSVLAQEKDKAVVNATYRRAILKALESLHDYHSRSNIDAIRRHTQDILTEDHIRNYSTQKDEGWNDVVFLQTLKAMFKKGEVDLFNKSTAELSNDYKKKRADSLLQRLTDAEERALFERWQYAQRIAQEQAHQQEVLRAQLLQQEQLRAQLQQTSSLRKHKDKDAPVRGRSEHEKWKIVPKKIYDHSTIVNPMDTHE